jgi:Leucine-rich repeat (LRR) protein
MSASPDLPRRLAHLKTMLAEIAKRRSPRIFLPPYTPAELAEIESKLGVTLPDDQRAFLLEVTGGEEDTGWGPILPPTDGILCLHSDARPSAPLTADGAMNGLLPLLDGGCGEYTCVALTGEQRGKMWMWWDGGLAPITPETGGEGEPLGFLDWVEREIENALAAAPPPIDANAKEIQLSGQQLDAIPPEVFTAVAAEMLDLSLNPLGTLPDEIGNLTALRVLLIQDDDLDSLPPSIGALTRLERLFACKNRLRQLPDSIGDLAQLERLELWDNQLRSLPSTVARLTSLVELDLSGNHLTELPEAMAGMRALRTLKIARNPLQRLPEGLAQTSLEAMDLERLPSLDLAQALAVLARLRTLRALEIAGYRRPPPSLAAFARLEGLRLSNLGLLEVPPEIFQMRNLETLSLDQNEIRCLPDELLALPKLKSVALYDNLLDEAYVERLRARYPRIAFHV